MRNVFVSYSHRLDQDEADKFRRKFGTDKTWILVKRDDAVWLSLRKKRINTSD